MFNEKVYNIQERMIQSPWHQHDNDTSAGIESSIPLGNVLFEVQQEYLKYEGIAQMEPEVGDSTSSLHQPSVICLCLWKLSINNSSTCFAGGEIKNIKKNISCLFACRYSQASEKYYVLKQGKIFLIS